MLKQITQCYELGTSDTRKIADMVSNAMVPEKNRILAYLKQGQDNGVYCSSVYDYIKDFSTGDTIHCYTDGEYQWDDEEIYHYEKYNIPLNSEFIKKIVGS